MDNLIENKTVGRKRLSGEQRQIQITEAARRVFVKQGLRGARTKDIAAEAGINEALLYRHFSSKEELFEAAVVEPLDDAVANLVSVAGAPPAAADTTGDLMVERTRLFIVDLLKVMHEVAPLLGVMLFDQEDAAAVHYRERIGPRIDQVAEVVQTNLAWWTHRPFNPHELVRFVFGAVWFEATTARLTGNQLRIESLADEIANTLIRGLLVSP